MTAPFTGGGALANTIARAVSAPVARVIALFGSDVTIYRKTSVRQLDASTIRKWAPIATEQRLVLSQLTAQQARRVWGSELVVLAQGLGAVALDLQGDDGIQVTAGPLTGQRFLVGETKPDQVAGALIVALVAPPREAFT